MVSMALSCQNLANNIYKMLGFILFYHPDTRYNLFAVLLAVGAENHGATSALRTGAPA